MVETLPGPAGAGRWVHASDSFDLNPTPWDMGKGSRAAPSAFAGTPLGLIERTGAKGKGVGLGPGLAVLARGTALARAGWNVHPDRSVRL
jgi:hypothetical protein